MRWFYFLKKYVESVLLRTVIHTIGYNQPTSHFHIVCSSMRPIITSYILAISRDGIATSNKTSPARAEPIT